MKKEFRLILGIIFLITGFLIHFVSYSLNDILIFIASFVLISISFFILVSSIKRKIAYLLMSLLNGVSAPLIVYILIETHNYNYVNMDFFNMSIILGVIGIIIGFIGIFFEKRIMNSQKGVFISNTLLILQIILWNISVLFAIISPCMALY